MNRYEITVYVEGEMHCWTALAPNELQARMDALERFEGRTATARARLWRR